MNDNKHNLYDSFAEKWFKTRSACEGQSAVHKAGEKFLPRLTEQTDNDYNSYKMRATYFNATGRTLDALVGMVFRKEPKAIYPDSFKPIMKDLTLAGDDFEMVAMKTINDLIETGRVGILVEYPQVNQTLDSQADVIKLNLRPYATYYPAESILDWKISRVNNIVQPIMIKLAEKYEVQKNEFEYECKDQIRALLLINNMYVQRIYRKNSEGQWYQDGDDIIPLLQGKPINQIPFWAFGAKSNTLDLQDPPILDLADVNLAHYRVSADYERGCHFTGLPTPILAGFVLDENESVSIGSTKAIVSQDSTSKWGFLEFTGQGLSALVENLRLKESQMASLGSRMLAPEKAGVESAQALELKSGGETSALASLVNLANDNFESMLSFMAMWYGIKNPGIEIDLNTDFMPQEMSPQQLDALMRAWQMGGLPKEELFHNLKRGEIIRQSVTYDEYTDQINDDISGMPNPNGNGDE